MTVIRSVSRASQILVHLGEQQESRSAKEIAAALGARILEREGSVGLPPRPVVTLWWNGHV